MALLNQFPYEDLETPSTIRLIKLEKRKINGLLVCDVHYREQTRATYTALSYCWGDDTEIRQIYLRRRPGGRLYLFPVHDSLGRFLDWAWNQRICSTWIWTDKICLDQSDRQEKQQQIPRMGDIFRNAEKVLAWLDMTKREGECLTPILDFENFFRGHKWKRCLKFNKLPQEMQSAVKQFSRLAYWRRVWVVQECAVAKKIVFVIGNKQASFEKVETGVS
ncbi:heterokaryon incompatibility protein-domain-containing protein, partial [Phyllosticta citribraziliensis]